MMPRFSMDVCKTIFDNIDRNRGGTINYDEFLQKFQPMLSSSRRKIVDGKFSWLDTSKQADRSNPVITVNDFMIRYDISPNDKTNIDNIKKHITTVLGNYNVDDGIRKISIINGERIIDITSIEQITYKEFINYYSDMSLRFIPVDDENEDVFKSNKEKSNKEFQNFVDSQWTPECIFEAE
jgi:hypothetical protein